MPRIRGDQMILLINGEVVPCAKSYDLAYLVGEVEVSSETSTAASSFEPERTAWTISGDYVYDTDDDNFASLFSLASTRQTFTVQIQYLTDDGAFWNGTGFISALVQNAAIDQAAGFTVNIRGTGDLIQDFFVNFWVDESLDFVVDENDDFIVF